MKPGRRPIPAHRVEHGTTKGVAWHANRRRNGEPDHEYCARCKKVMRERANRYRRDMRNRQRRLAAILVGGQALRDPTVTPEVAKALEKLLRRHYTTEELKDIYD